MNETFKTHFPVFRHHPELAYLDNAATTQRPQQVIDRLTEFHTSGNANTHRGVYSLSNKATRDYEAVRSKAADFLGVKDSSSIAFTRGTTESINAVAHGYLAPRLQPGDNIVTTVIEHHSNLLAWQQLALQHQVELRTIPVDRNGDLDLSGLSGLLDNRTRLVAVNHISNTVGTINPIGEIIDLAHQHHIPVLVDAAQSAAFYDLDHRNLDYDFLALSGHKMFGPFGSGVLFTRPELKSEMQPFQWGGGMIKEVTIAETKFADYPALLEAGTPNVSGAIGLGAAIDLLQSIDRQQAVSYLHRLTESTREALKKVPGVQILGNPKEQSGIVSFSVQDIHPHDVASFLDQDNIAIRAGMHCTQPLLAAMGTPFTARVSFTLYNDPSEIDRLAHSLSELVKFWG